MSCKIKKLPEEVINRIAAGEVIQRPSSGFPIKELLENSIDAGSDMISIVCLEGGFSLIEISDNGTGIDPEDFPLLCERFATSKLQSFEDLKSIGSFGFRGEALASISYVSNLTIKSKKIDKEIGYKATFKDGIILNNSIELIQMNKGTIIESENLFYNLSIRRNSLNNRDEIKEILKLIYKLSIHHYNIKFKFFSSRQKLEFSSYNLLNKDKEKRKELISNIFKINSNKLIEIQEYIKDYQVNIECILTELDTLKKLREIYIFINERLIDSESIKKVIDLTYKTFWNSIHENEGGYFCYINLKMKQENIDVNVDPRKKFVKFIFENEICDQLGLILESNLKEKCSIRDYNGIISLKQTKIDISKPIITLQINNNLNFNENNKKIYDKNLVRVDPNVQSLMTFMNNKNKKEPIESNLKTNNSNIDNNINNDQIFLNLIMKIKDKCDNETTKFFHNLTYLGCLSSNYILSQLDQHLYIINSIPICLETFYFKALSELKKNDYYEVKINIFEGLKTVLKSANLNEIELNKKIKDLIKIISIHKNILLNYFSLNFEIENNMLITFPKLFDLPLPKLSDIQEFIYLILTEIEKSTNEEIVHTVCKEISFIYSWDLESQNFFDDSQTFYNDFFRDSLFPFMKKNCLFKKLEINEFSYILLKLEDIYKIFERC